jgi:chemotaxis protein histidine kinase CheA
MDLDQQETTSAQEWDDLLDESVAASAEQVNDQEEVVAPSAEELGRLLAEFASEVDSPVDIQTTSRDAKVTTSVTTSQASLKPPAIQKIEIEPDLLEAYLDDATRCLTSLETATLRLEQDPRDRPSLGQLCRELHTMKGASASVGLVDLANYLHTVEEAVQAACDSQESSIDFEHILAGVDSIRDHVTQLGPNQVGAPTPVISADLNDGGSDQEETLRIKASHLDRLMDMLAELVMLRNRRESRAAELQTSNDELMQCASRLRMEADSAARTPTARDKQPWTEISSDLLEITRNQRAISERVSEENLAVSDFIRSFRQELTGLQRLPIAGLFRRLQRVVRDAAQQEHKKVRLRMIGEHAGLKRTLQERLYEPLLHIVRNAVSHGIESESARIAAGKDPVGTIELEALGGSNLLVLEIRDDGRGLDYEALRRRGIERQLIPSQQPASREELAQLIFHPGFSTKTESTSVSGRGIGMDVVAESLKRMNSWVEVESEPNHGTCIRLSIPLHSVIEHSMVFRSAGQLLAVPMQFVHWAGSAKCDTVEGNTVEGNDVRFLESGPTDLPAIHVSELFANGQVPSDEPHQRLVLGYGRQVLTDNRTTSATDPTVVDRNRRFELHVDEIVGPEEVVIRPLPPLLRQQDMFSGVTLSGRGELVLLFDSRRLIDLGLRLAQQTPCQAGEAQGYSKPSRPQVLVADDSLIAIEQLGLSNVDNQSGGNR